MNPGDMAIEPYKQIPESQFYVYAMQKDLPPCAYEDCGMSGALVACMGGWVSNAWKQDAPEFGLNELEVEAGKASVVIVADKDSKIVGIYPHRTTHNIPSILKNHPELSDALKGCYDYHVPR